MTDATRVMIEVVAGIIPGRPIPERTRLYFIGSAEWDAASPDEQQRLLMQRNADALSRAAGLMAQPDRLNWVRVEWVWL
jgi:hypothetical protein